MRGRLSVIVVLIVAGTVVAPPAQSATRYRDIVFRSAKVTKDLVYGAAVNHKGQMETLRLDVHEPAGDTAKLRAAVVYVHGGYFVEGDKSGYQDSTAAFARAGFVTFMINYRLQDKETFPYGAAEAVTGLQIQRYLEAIRDAQHDAQAAIRWVRKNAKKYRVNPNMVAIAGKSAGGITAQQVTYNDHDPGNSGNPGYSSRPDAGVSFAGTGLPGLTTRVDFLEPPMLQIHGLADDVVPFTPFNCLTAIALLNTCEFVIDPDQDHDTFGWEFAREFLWRQMTNKPNGIRPPTKVTITGLR